MLCLTVEQMDIDLVPIAKGLYLISVDESINNSITKTDRFSLNYFCVLICAFSLVQTSYVNLVLIHVCFEVRHNLLTVSTYLYLMIATTLSISKIKLFSLGE